jgi:spoIIIJ-associated protein
VNPIESEGPTVAEAVDAALRQHGLRREQVEVTVLQEGHAGFLGMGTKLARVRLTEKRWGDGPIPTNAPPKPAAPARKPAARRTPAAPPPPRPYIPPPAPVPARPAPRPEPRPEPRREAAPAVLATDRSLSPADAAVACEKARTLVLELLQLMKIAAPTVSASWDTEMERVKLVVESQDAPEIVGRDGRVLESLQFLSTLIMSRGAAVPVAVQVDALSYWEKREAAIIEGARRGADRVLADGKPYRLEPMDASMRRLIHRTFSNHPSVTTSSEGEGPWRKIVLRPRQG